jgi:GT2 family glycosyltransferase
MADGAAGKSGVFVHILTFNSEVNVLRCIESVLGQRGFLPGTDLQVHFTDNASSNDVPDLVAARFGDRIRVHRNSANLGFCGGHNQGVAAFLKSNCEYLLILNPDVRLEADALAILCRALGQDSSIGLACPRLYRADQNLDPVPGALLDCAGMYMTPALRHFDRGSNLPDSAEFARDCFVFGGSGACLLLKRSCVEDLLLSGHYEADVDRLYPQLSADRSNRRMLFDEAFFAYREDAELAWRAQLFGWKCICAAGARGYHKRVVLSTNRHMLPAELNKLGVRNRFLLQLLHLYPSYGLPVVLSGALLRNAMVAAGILLRERQSLPALGDLLRLRRRILERRALIAAKWRVRPTVVRRWFRNEAYVEPVSI